MTSKIFTARNLLIVAVTLIVTLAFELYKTKNPHSDYIAYINILSSFTVAILTSILVGIYFELFTREEVSNSMLHHFGLSKEVINAGLLRYYSSFSDFDFRGHLSKAKIVDMYLTYGQTLFNNYNDTIIEFAKTKNKQLNIFIYHEDNIFVNALEQHWNYNSLQTGTRQKIIETKTMLINQFNELNRTKKLKAKVTLVFLKRHPVFYSFYRFDDLLLLCPSKISHVKAVKPFAFLFKKTEQGDDVYNKCMVELESVTSDAIFYERITF
jgi:hypothetical protein